jgi:hypothetical protein
MVEYPVSLPLEAAQLCLEITKTRAIAARKAEFGLASWNVQGYIQRVTLGMPALPGDPSNPEVVIPQIEDAIYELEAALVDYEDEGVEMQFGAESPEEQAEEEKEAGSVFVVIAIAGLILQLVQAWRNREPKDS